MIGYRMQRRLKMYPWANRTPMYKRRPPTVKRPTVKRPTNSRPKISQPKISQPRVRKAPSSTRATSIARRKRR